MLFEATFGGSGLGAVLLVFRLLRADRLHANRVSHGVHLADGVSGRSALRLRLLLGPVDGPSSAVHDARHCRRHRRRLHGGRRVTRLSTRRADLQPSPRPILAQVIQRDDGGRGDGV